MYPGDYDDEEEFDEGGMSDTGEGVEEEPAWNGHYGGGTGEEDTEPEENGEQDDSGEGDGYGKDIDDGYGEDQNPDGGENPEEEGQEENNQKKNQDEQDVEVEGEGTKKSAWQKRKMRALIRRNAHKYATVMGILPIGCKPESIPCPGCGEKSIYKSKTLTDMFIFRVLAPVGNIYMCMNSGQNCKCSFEHGKCWITNGPFTIMLRQVPYPLKLLRFQK